MRLLLVAVLAAFVASCGSQNTQKGAIQGPSFQGIINGIPVQENEELGKVIVAVYDTQVGFLCSGSILSEDIVVTAAHCVVSKPQKIKIIFHNEPMSVANARELDVLQEYTRMVLQTRVHPGYKDQETTDKDTDQNDIALLKFRGGLRAGYKPATLLPDEKMLQKGVMATMAGFGVNKISVEEVEPRKVKKLKKAIEEGKVICDEDLTECMYVDTSGDGLLRRSQAPVSVVAYTEVRLDESKQGTCVGDSGGPAYLEKEGQYYLFGLTSRGDILCNKEGVYTNILSHSQWIETATKSMGQ